MSTPTYGGFFESSELTDAQVDAIETRFAPLTDEPRGLVDLAIRSEVDDDAVAAAVGHLRAAATLLGSRARPGPAGVCHNVEGGSWQWGDRRDRWR